MRWLLSGLMVFLLANFSCGRADDAVIREFSGTGATTSDFFTVGDRWEVRWNARRVVSVAVMSADGSIVAGSAGVLRGSLFLPLGGRFYFKINDDGQAGSASDVSWHLQVVQVSPESAGLTVYTPYFVPPDSAIAPAGVPATPARPKLTDAQAGAVVTVQGDNARGDGFVVKTAAGQFIAVPLDLLAGNPNLNVATPAGASLTTSTFKGALDRDLALLAMANAPQALALPDNFPATAQLGDQLLIPGVGDGNEMTLAQAQLSGSGPGRIDFSESSRATTSNGLPVIDVPSGKVLAMAMAPPRTNLSAAVAKAWPANAASASDSRSFFGMRLDDVRGWETYDPARFLAETLFLRHFHQDTRCLDSYLNASTHHHHYHSDEADSNAPDAQVFQDQPKIVAAQKQYQQLAGNGDRDERLDAARQLLFELQGIADTDVTRLQGMDSPYAYSQSRAKEELSYRQALKAQLDGYQDDIASLDDIARSR